jgi:sugar phosphate isomerase/epimerase
MYISLNATITTGRVPWPEFVRLAARLGFGGAEVNLGRAMEAGVAETKAIFEHLRIKPAAAGFPVEFRKDEQAFRQSMAKLEAQAKFLADIGCHRVATWIAASSDTPKAELRSRYKARFSEAAKVLADHGIRLGLEFLGPLHLRRQHPHEFIWRMDEMTAFAAECGPNVGLLLDAWHWHHAGATVKDILAAGKQRIVHVHISDAKKLPPEEVKDMDRLMPGEGVIDWDGFFGALKKIGYEDAVSPEVFGRGLKDMTPEEAARLALDSARAAMRKAGVA